VTMVSMMMPTMALAGLCGASERDGACESELSHMLF
jgi:hypothetical protein